MGTVVLVHGIGNLVRGASPEQAAELKAAAAADRLRKGLSAAGLSHVPLPGLVMAYYAHQLTDDYRPERQSAGRGVLEDLTSAQEGEAWEWLETAGVARPREGQAGMLSPLRWAVDRLVEQRAGDAQPAARKRLAELLSRLVVATLQDTDAYTSRPARREAVRATVAQAVREHGARVVVAHSLGSVVAYETLHAHPDVDIDLLLTLGSPLGLPAIMRKLEPEPVDGRGARPPGVRHWVNIADVGDLLAVPRELGGAFPVDVHATTDIGLFDPHTLGGYLAAGLTAAALAPHCAD
ncbi:hypothetical protein ACIQNT_06935 [Streptomyces luteogriseus]|uniref:Serine peptidase n=1 Tax=Streptomyces luteogriseus TaxID=68233 RepID=A0A7W7DJ14_9ACTN|nr:hypothetical protein [Streptomyces luteogriseus]MBB4711607.1 hypothetical protein [Streptomyces luteogriseus]